MREVSLVFEMIRVRVNKGDCESTYRRRSHAKKELFEKRRCNGKLARRPQNTLGKRRS